MTTMESCEICENQSEASSSDEQVAQIRAHIRGVLAKIIVKQPSKQLSQVDTETGRRTLV